MFEDFEKVLHHVHTLLCGLEAEQNNPSPEELKELRKSLNDIRPYLTQMAAHSASPADRRRWIAARRDLDDCRNNLAMATLPAVRGCADDLMELLAKVGVLTPFPKLATGLPTDLLEQLALDHDEMVKAFNGRAYRATIAFAGRFLECALAHRYTKMTGADLSGKKWPLGTLVDECEKANVINDSIIPGIDMLLKWMNKSRIETIHVKGKPYIPTPEDAKRLVEMAVSVVVTLLR